LTRSPFIYELLQRIHGSYFEGLNHLCFHFESYFRAL
jgi:hypothetical protein